MPSGVYPRTKTFVEKFWERVNKNGPVHPYKPELGRCWLWTAGTNGKYGQIRLPKELGMKTKLAHVVSFELENGPPIDKVLHTCDVFLCVNPTHLYDGTPSDNANDAYERGRKLPFALKAEDSPSAKLNWDLVRRMREESKLGKSVAAIARDFNHSYSNTYRIVMFETWKEDVKVGDNLGSVKKYV